MAILTNHICKYVPVNEISTLVNAQLLFHPFDHSVCAVAVFSFVFACAISIG